ncbi:MAG: hypothetical protein M1820_009847 [Bogoriella megaspora]|nr:MAG: hypothetical protein M1820_009847 [Bogoriella megaspora]
MSEYSVNGVSESHVPAWKRLGLKLKNTQGSAQYPQGLQPANQLHEHSANDGHAKGFNLGVPLGSSVSSEVHESSSSENHKKRKASTAFPSKGRAGLENVHSSSSQPSRILYGSSSYRDSVSELGKSPSGHVEFSRKGKNEKRPKSSARDGIEVPVKGSLPSTEQDGSSDSTRSQGQLNSPKTRRKSVTFTSDTKTEDGSGAQKSFSNWVADKADQVDHSAPSPASTAYYPSTKRLSQLEFDAEEEVAKRRAIKRQKRENRRRGTGSNVPPYVRYVQQFHTARDTWKFNKNQQNNLLKHIFNLYHVPETYEPAIEAYITGLQGASIRSKLKKQALEILEAKRDSPSQNAEQNGDTEMEDPKARAEARDSALQHRLHQNEALRANGEALPYPSSNNHVAEAQRRRAENICRALDKSQELYPIAAFNLQADLHQHSQNDASTSDAGSKKSKLVEQTSDRKRSRKNKKRRTTGDESSESSSSESSNPADPRESGPDTSESESESSGSETESESESESSSESSSSSESESESQTGSGSSVTAPSNAGPGAGPHPHSDASSEESELEDASEISESDEGITSSSSSSSPSR